MKGESGKIRVKPVVLDIRAGLDPSALRAKYDLTEKQFKVLLKKLLQMGALKQPELSSYLNAILSRTDNEEVSASVSDPRLTSSRPLQVRSSHDPLLAAAKSDQKREAVTTVPSKTASPPKGKEESETLSDPKATVSRFVCPACNAPQPKEHEVCPQCGVIVGKFRRKQTDEDDLKKQARVKRLWKAVYRGSTRKVADMLDKGVPVNVLDRHGRTPLIVAASRGDRAVVELLLARGADLTIASANWGTALSQALTKRHLDIAEILGDNESVAKLYPSKRSIQAHMIAGFICATILLILHVTVPLRGLGPADRMAFLLFKLVFAGLGLAFFIKACYDLAFMKGYDPGIGLLAGIMSPIGPIVLLVVPYSAKGKERRRRSMDKDISGLSYREIIDRFRNAESRSTSLQRETEWRTSYRNKWVKWRGYLKDVTSYGPGGVATIVTIRMDEGGLVELYVRRKARDEAARKQKDSLVTFIGRLYSPPKGSEASLTLQAGFFEP